MWFTTPLKAFKQQQQASTSKPEKQEEETGKQETQETDKEETETEDKQEEEEEQEAKNLVLNHHPNINTPVPSYPKTVTLNSLKKAQRQSELNFLNNFIRPVTTVQEQTQEEEEEEPEKHNLASSTLRLIEQEQSSMIALPYPNPDISSTINVESEDIQPERRISALPSRAHTPFKLFKPQPSPKLPSTLPIDFAQQTRSPLANKHINSFPETTSANHGEYITSPKQLPTSPARQETNKIIFPTPSAAISDIFKAQEDRAIIPSSTTIDQVMAELENRTEAGPRITKITFQDHQQESTQPTAGRFTDVHGKQFAKYDSITNHYAAKRKIDAPTITGRSVTNPCKRAKVSDFGYPKPIVTQAETDTEQAEKKKESLKRQLELARSRRRTGARTSTLGSKPGSSKPPPSGFSSFGTRLIKSAVKTVTGAFKASEKAPRKVNGVGFGVPAGLGVGPAKVPIAGSSQAKRIIGPPTRMVSKPPLSRLPPAGHHRITSSNTNSISEAARRRVISGPPTSSLTGASKIPPRAGATTRAQTQTQTTWQPKTLPRPTPAAIARSGSSSSNTRTNVPRARQVTQPNLPNSNRTTNTTTTTTSSTIVNPRSRIPKINGQTIIRPTVKAPNNNGHDQGSKRGMMNSTSTTCSSSTTTKSVIKIGLSSKTIPAKLSQPIHSTKPKKSYITRNPPLRRTTTIGGTGTNPSVRRKSSIHPSNLNSVKNRNVTNIDLPSKRKLVLGSKNRRRSSLKNVGTKAISHRVTSS
ncbi:hypothetical protein PSTG_14181 [Puccinia striiformis f. sp. tritici PST-78]|uniref:Uncharacterized protein n=1 Tax=Puccinia striiformis f. sp. tritici PST-78 TaxID=1165861 RepID=A0A0L0V070_9BASI|nr:hypothetical protein PSTG_14181 [Puccinia striiformis f. sp. tritici PST-78]